jgi:hypothetical protein
MSASATATANKKPALVSTLGLTHLCFLIAIAGYLAWFYSASLASIGMLTACAILAETVPHRLRRFLIGELLVFGGILISFLLFADVHNENFLGWVRMALACWLLSPSRPGLLMWLLSLVIAELLMIGNARGSLIGIGEGHSAMLAIYLLVPLGVACLAADAWLRGAIGARGGRGRAHVRPLIVRLAVPVVIIAVLALVPAKALVERASQQRKLIELGNSKVSGISQVLQVGDYQWIDPDPQLKARMMPVPESDARFGQSLLSGSMYLRASALPLISVNGSQINWSDRPAKSEAVTEIVDNAFDAHLPYAWIVMLAPYGNIVLHPDGAAGVELPEVRSDRYGNLSKSGFFEDRPAYKANLAFPGDWPNADDADSATGIPAELHNLPWEEVEDSNWSKQSGEEAATAICAYLQARCAYDLVDLPTPVDKPGGALLTFLFDKSTNNRRGYCAHFAMAAALLLRHSGHPARCVIGFSSDEHDEAGYYFRGCHAHAWIEVVNRQGKWERFDPTPPRTQRMPDPEMLKNMPVPAIELPKTDAASEESPLERGRVVLTIIVITIFFAALLWWWRRRTARADPRLHELIQQSESLYRLAVSLGVQVGPHTTLTMVADQIGKRTGTDLGVLLHAHLAARYGNGPLPPPWPLAELRARARTFRQAQ